MLSMSATSKLIMEQVSQIIDSEIFKKWIDAVKPPKPGYIVFNNSFFFRETQKTTKASGYLSVRVEPAKDGVKFGGLFVLEGFSINLDFQYIPDGTGKIDKVLTLEQSLTALLEKFGKVAFVFIGNIKDDVSVAVEINESGVKKLVLSPQQKDLVSFNDGDLSIRELLDDEPLWTELQTCYKPDGKTVIPPPDVLAASLSKALTKLRETAYVRLTLPDEAKKETRTMLDDITSAFDDANKAYKNSLGKCGGDYKKDQQEFNNVLRLAYNFTTDAVDFLKLIAQLSDLKPPILYATVGAQFNLSNSFRELPWPRSEQKGSLKLYDATIKGARNRAFHRLFPFSKAINVDVSSLSFKATKLLLFPEFTSRKGNQLDYEDRELVEIMTQFSRTTEHTVTPVFWQKNLAVMENTVALLKQLKTALFAILSDQKGIKT